MKFELHPHQVQTIAALKASLMAGHRRPMVQAPTGAGKTVIASAIIESALNKGNSVLFVVPFVSLIDQTVAAFAKQDIDRVGVIQGHHPGTDGTQPVQVASLQTLERRALPKAGLVIIDEAHRWFRFYADWMSRADWQKVPFIGLTATPWAKGLGRYYDDLIVAARTSDLIAQGLLSPFRTFAPAHPDLSAVATMAGDYHEGQLSEAMSKPVLVADIVSTWLRLGEDRPTLCFCVDRAHARRVADQFEVAGVPTAYVDAKTPLDERGRIGNRLREGQIKVICNVGTMTTGVDLDVRCIILARPTKSEILFTQIVGRGLRTAEGKADCLILDHSDTTLRLGFVTDIHHETLDDGTHTARSGKSTEKPTPLPKECKACSFLKPAGVHVCPSCGFAPERQSAIEEHAGSLIQLSGKAKRKGNADAHTPQQVYSMLLWVQADRGYRPGFAVAKYKARYGTWPRGLRETSLEPDRAFTNWLKSTQIAFHKGRQKGEAHAA